MYAVYDLFFAAHCKSDFLFRKLEKPLSSAVADEDSVIMEHKSN